MSKREGSQVVGLAKPYFIKAFDDTFSKSAEQEMTAFISLCLNLSGTLPAIIVSIILTRSTASSHFRCFPICWALISSTH